MAKLSLEKVMATSFEEMRDPAAESARKAFLDYNRRIRLLGETLRLRAEDIGELIKPRTPFSKDVSPVMAEVAGSALAETEQGTKLYLPGCSVVVAWAAHGIIGVYDNPNDDSTLTSYGAGLMWAMLKIGQEQYAAHKVKSTASLIDGYRAVSEALTGRDFDAIPHEERHHIGGSSGFRSFYPKSDSMRALEGEILLAGVSGVLTTERFRRLAGGTPVLGDVVKQAEITDVLGGFDGNFMAGSLDSTLGTLMLEQVIEPGVTYGRFTDRAIASAAARHADGINVH